VYILTSTFDADTAVSKVAELLALGDQAERLAEKLGLPKTTEQVQEGVKAVSFKKLISDVEKLKTVLTLEQDIEKLKQGHWSQKFVGRTFIDSKLTSLVTKKRKLGSIVEAPRWYYKQPRVWLLAAIRDYALDASNQNDAEWVDTEQGALVDNGVITMFETGDVAKAKQLAVELEKPLADVDPKFVLEHVEGQRSFHFNLKVNSVTYFAPVRGI
jgi:hypothetical protein